MRHPPRGLESRWSAGSGGVRGSGVCTDGCGCGCLVRREQRWSGVGAVLISGSCTCDRSGSYLARRKWRRSWIGVFLLIFSAVVGVIAVQIVSLRSAPPVDVDTSAGIARQINHACTRAIIDSAHGSREVGRGGWADWFARHQRTPLVTAELKRAHARRRRHKHVEQRLTCVGVMQTIDIVIRTAGAAGFIRLEAAM